jgi:hypothetical protein
MRQIQELQVAKEGLISEVAKLRRVLSGLDDVDNKSPEREVRFSEESSPGEDRSRRLKEAEEIQYLVNAQVLKIFFIPANINNGYIQREQIEERDALVESLMISEQTSEKVSEVKKLRREVFSDISETNEWIIITFHST